MWMLLPPTRPPALQYMQDCNANLRILEEPLLVTGIGVAFALNDTRGLDEKLADDPCRHAR